MVNDTYCPLVSVIIPAFNAEISIRETIESVLNQSYRNWEVLVIDDSSTDNTVNIVKNYAEKNENIRIFQTDHPSGSPALPRNIGIENARGKYIAFLDADDIWLQDKLSIQVAFLEKKEVDLVYSYYEKIDNNGNRDNRIVKTKKISTYSSLLHSNSIPCLTSIISRKAIGETRFKNIPQEDFCFWLDILKKGYQAFNVCQVTALYRETSLSRSSNKMDMFRGYWNVIRNEQNVNLITGVGYMVSYTILGVIKYLK